MPKTKMTHTPGPTTKQEALDQLGAVKMDGDKLSAMIEDAERGDRADIATDRFSPERSFAQWAPVLAFEKKFNEFKELAQNQYRRFAD